MWKGSLICADLGAAKRPLDGGFVLRLIIQQLFHGAAFGTAAFENQGFQITISNSETVSPYARVCSNSCRAVSEVLALALGVQRR